MRQPQVAGQLVRGDVEADKLPRRSVRRTAALNLPWVIQGDGPWPGLELLAVQPHFFLAYKVHADHAFVMAVAGKGQAGAMDAVDFVVAQPGVLQGAHGVGSVMGWT